MTEAKVPFWETKTLEEMTQQEWEALCDGCGLCCLNKLQDEETGEIVYTKVVCSYANLETGQCSDYENRSTNVPTCVPLTRERVAEFDWLPDSCSYRLIYHGQPLPDWHPLITKDPASTRKNGFGITAIPVVVDRPGLDLENYLLCEKV